MANKEMKRLIKNTAIIAVGNFSTRLVSFFLLPLYTGILTQEEYGTYDYILSIMTFVIPLVTLLVSESMFRFLIDAKDSNESGKIISETVLISLTGLFIFCVATGGILYAIDYPYATSVLWYGISHILSGLIPAILRGQGKMQDYAIFNFGTSVLTIITNVITIAFLKLGVNGLFLGFIVSHLGMFLFYAVRMRLWKFLKFNTVSKDGIVAIVKYSIPMVPNKLSWTIVDMSCRIIITNMISVAANGIFSIANKFPTLINTFYQFFYQAWTESSARVLKDGKESAENFYNSVYDKLKRVLFAIVIMIVVSMPIAFKFLINENFYEAYLHVPLLAFGMYFSNISGFYGGIFTAYKDTKILGTSTAVGAGINLVLNIALIKIFGLYAAGLATIISNMAISQYRCHQTKKYIKLKGNTNFLIVSTAISIVIGILYYVNTPWSCCVNILIGGIYSAYINRRLIGSVLLSIKNKGVAPK